MRRDRRSVGSLVAVGAATLAVLAVAAPAWSDDGIPRPPAAIENRGWELVSKADLNGNQVDPVWRLTDDGTRVQYGVTGGVEGSSTGAASRLEATRTASGWVSRNILPPPEQMIDENYLVAATAPDLSGGIWVSYHGLSDETETPYATLVRLDANGGQTVLYRHPVPFSTNTEYVASDDLRHVYGNVLTPIDDDHVLGTFNVYDFGSGTPSLVSRMPGTGLPPTCGVPMQTVSGAGFVDGMALVSQHWTSIDGTRVWWLTRGDVCSDPVQLYLRDIPGATTTLVSGPPPAGDPDHGVQRFLQAAPDGSQVLYETATSLESTDDGDGDHDDVDIYRWTPGGGNVCLTCAVPSADVTPGMPAQFAAAVSADFSHVYFTSPNQLADAPAPGSVSSPNLYVWRDDGTTHGTIAFVAPSDGVEPFWRGSATGVTPDGDVLIFRSRQPGLDALSGSANGGFFQFYRYDDRDGSIACVSCPSPGRATADVPLTDPVFSQAVMAELRVLSDDGSTFVFKTSEALVPEDRNAGQDIYEWHDGAVGLITSGTTDYARLRKPLIVTISRDGRDILFEDSTPLAGDVQGYAQRLYDARIDGGFPPSPAPPAPCAEDACQGPSPAPPSLLDPSSGSLIGDGNLSPTRSVRLAVSQISAGKRARLVRTGRLSLLVSVTDAGRVSVVGSAVVDGRPRVVMRAAKALPGAGKATLRLRLARAGRAQLARAGHLRLVLVARCSTSASVKRVVLNLHVRTPRR